MHKKRRILNRWVFARLPSYFYFLFFTLVFVSLPLRAQSQSDEKVSEHGIMEELPDQEVDIGVVKLPDAAPQSNIRSEKSKDVDNKLKQLRLEKKKLEETLKRFDRKKRKLRYLARLKKKRRCA